MLGKIISLVIRGAIVGVGCVIVSLILYEINGTRGNVLEIGVFSVGLIGSLWALAKFNSPFKFVQPIAHIARSAGGSLATAVNEKAKRKTADEMFELKKLMDEGILSQEEYDRKMSSLKRKYLD